MGRGGRVIEEDLRGNSCVITPKRIREACLFLDNSNILKITVHPASPLIELSRIKEDKEKEKEKRREQN